MRSAVAAVSGSPGPPVLVYGFYDATWLQRRLIYETLAFRQGAVFFPCGSEPGDVSYDYTLPMLDWFRSFITERVDLTDREASAPPPEVTLLSAPGEAREAVEAVRWLVSRARERSVPFGEMALLYRLGEAYRTALADIMSTAGGVPHYMAEGTPVGATLGARALRLLLAAREDDLSRRTVIDIFSLTMRDSQTSLWDWLSREAGVVRGFDEWSLRLAKLESRKLLGFARGRAGGRRGGGGMEGGQGAEEPDRRAARGGGKPSRGGILVGSRPTVHGDSAPVRAGRRRARTPRAADLAARRSR